MTLSDIREGAWTADANGVTLTTYASGAFFCGLMRPWMGIHTADLVRRDAAWSKRWFKTERIGQSDQVRVTVCDDRDEPHIQLVYLLDMERDLLSHIEFVVDGTGQGDLEFTWLDDVDDVRDTYAMPTTAATLQPPSQPAPGLPWLFRLAEEASGPFESDRLQEESL